MNSKSRACLRIIIGNAELVSDTVHCPMMLYLLRQKNGVLVSNWCCGLMYKDSLLWPREPGGMSWGVVWATEGTDPRWSLTLPFAPPKAGGVIWWFSSLPTKNKKIYSFLCQKKYHYMLHILSYRKTILHVGGKYLIYWKVVQ